MEKRRGVEEGGEKTDNWLYVFPVDFSDGSNGPLQEKRSGWEWVNQGEIIKQVMEGLDGRGEQIGEKKGGVGDGRGRGKL